MMPTDHADSNGHLILLFVIPTLGEKKICFCIIENWKINDGLDYLLI